MSQEVSRVGRFLYRAASVPLIGYTLLLCWQKRWLPIPRRRAIVRLNDGRLLRCNLSDKTQRTMYLGLFEPAETSLITRLLAAGDIFIDIGAHIGWFATIAANRVGQTGEVIAFEPYPANAAALTENLALNDTKNVRVVQAALGSGTGALSLGSSGDSGGITALDWAHDSRVEVPMTTLDEVADAVDIALVKVDVEGWEAHVLRGATETLKRTRNVLIEINRPALLRAGSSSEELFDLLRSSGFTNFVPIAQAGLRRLSRVDVFNVLASR